MLHVDMYMHVKKQLVPSRIRQKNASNIVLNITVNSCNKKLKEFARLNYFFFDNQNIIIF